MEKAIVYGTADCPFCSQAKAYLTRKGIDFVYYDVSKDQSKAREMVEKSKQGAVPVLEVNGNILVGFNKAAIDRALAMQRVDPAILKQNLTFDFLDQ